VEHYKGNPNLKKANQEIEWSPDLAQEIMKCMDDPVYFTETYMKIVHVDHGLINFNLYDYQKDMLYDMRDNRFNAFCMARQSGKSITVCAFILWYIIFNKNKEVGILANKGDTAREILGRIQLAYQHLPKWLTHGVVEFNKGSFVLENGSLVIAAATSSDNVRGHSFALIYMDEVAFVENYDEFYASVFPTISSGKSTKVIQTSTPKGLNHFYKTIQLGKKVDTPDWNGFNVREIPWHRVPGRDEKWKETTLQALNNDLQKFNQEFNIEFLGSSGTLIAGWKLQELMHSTPIFEELDVLQYVAPQKDHIYIAIVDVSRGKGLDYSTIQVIDITKMPYQQVLTYRSNFVVPSDFSEIINRIGRSYNEAFVLIEINDIGQQVAELLFHDYEYENMLNTENRGRLGKQIVTGFGLTPNADRGIRTTKPVKNIGCSILKLLVEQNQLYIQDFNTIEELSTFSKKGVSYEAEPGCHDDLVMPLVLFAWLSDQPYFKDLTDISTLARIREIKSEQMQSVAGPLAFFVDGTPQKKVEVRGGDSWIIDAEFEMPKRTGWIG
jgi:hypothetical protein